MELENKDTMDQLVCVYVKNKRSEKKIQKITSKENVRIVTQRVSLEYERLYENNLLRMQVW